MAILSLAAAAGAVAPAGHARAQQDERIGSVDVHLQADSATGTDLGFAVVRADGGSLNGALVWACGGDPAGLAAGVFLRGRDRAGPRVAWRFGGGAADTSVLRTGQATLELLEREDAAPVARRARATERLVLQVLDAPGAEYAYSLEGLDSALDRLGCVDHPEPDGRAGLRTLQSMIGITDGPDTTVVTGLGVMEPPRLRNTADFQRSLSRNYPPLLMDAHVTGGVLLNFRVLEDGRVDSTSVRIHHSTHEQFSAPAVRSLRYLAFHPARMNGRPVKVWSQLPIEFLLAHDGPAPAPLSPRSMMELADYVRLQYPAELKAAGVEGEVVLRFRVLEDGRADPASIQVVHSTNEGFDDVAVRAAGRLRYVPPRAPPEGEESWVTETIRFLLPVGPP
ncbi:MAG TPA: energy transducer TonB [Longimicrobiaceae bacterium]|nr:energy transducer TonB [Longimicrobiaceae bacterium]